MNWILFPELTEATLQSCALASMKKGALLIVGKVAAVGFGSAQS
ncbi:hypothetical protein [Primorskyibacter sp. S87]